LNLALKNFDMKHATTRTAFLISTFSRIAIALVATLSTGSQALEITTWNLQHMMSPTIFSEWSTFCSRFGWDEDKVAAARADKPKRLTYCNAHNGLLFPTDIPESKPLQTQTAFAEKVAALIARRKALNSEIFALQEVSDEGAVASIFPPAQWSIVASKADISQNIAFAVRKDSGVKILASKQIDELAQTDDNGHRVRPGLELTVQVNGKRLVLLNVHLKASCRGQPISAPVRPGYANNKRWNEIQQGCKVMRAQVPVLESWIETQTRANAFYMIVGDWNRDMKRDLSLPARLETDESPKLPVTSSTKIGSMIKEISDNEPEGAWLAIASVKINARNKAVANPDQKSKEKVCHIGIDNFAVSDSLMSSLNLDKKSLRAFGEDYGAQAYAVDVALPSDHCPVTLSLPF
jgi:exonuclease III